MLKGHKAWTSLVGTPIEQLDSVRSRVLAWSKRKGAVPSASRHL